jgi:transcription initiation factor TFIID subunit 1
VLSKKDYFSSSTVYASVNSTVSVFDDENYDEEEEEPPNDNEPPGDGGDSAAQNLSSGDTG